MEHLMNVKMYASQQQDCAIFVPPSIHIPPSCSTLLKRFCSVVKEFRKLLTPCLYTSCATLTTVILVFFQGLFIFLLLLLDITIQDSFVTLDCWNSSRYGLTSYQSAVWSDNALDMKRPLQVTSSILITLFLLESVLRIIASGRRFIHQYWEILDFLIIIICFFLNISALVSSTVGKQVAQFIILLRLWRALELLSGSSFSSKSATQYAATIPELRAQLSSSSSHVMCDPSTYVAEQSVATLMLRIEELEQQVSHLQQLPTTGTCQRCVNHNWTTDDLLKLACMQLSRSDSRLYREDLRAAKSLSDLSLPESGYSSAQQKLPSLIYRLSDRIQQQQQRPLQTMLDIEDILLQAANGEVRQSVSELSEIKRIAQIQFCPDSKNHEYWRTNTPSLVFEIGLGKNVMMEAPNVETALFAWGNSHDGQLGLGSSETELFGEPQEVKFQPQTSSHVIHVATGRHHTLTVMSDGSLWSCGSNEFGQLGRSSDTGSLRRLGIISALQYHNIIQAAVGSDHSLALSDGGQIFSWGSSASGQCGRESDEEGFRVPKLVKQLAHEFILQIVAGNDFSLALSDGQLGLGHLIKVSLPSIVKSLAGVPVKQICAGGCHSIILSKSGAVFSAGRNKFGQLGLGDSSDRVHMSSVKSLKNQRVSYVCCGQEHSVALTVDGGVFTFGAGGTGQLGHGGHSGTGQLGHGGHSGNEMMPRKVFELMGSPVSQICAGRFHTVAYVGTTGKIYAFGLGASGQLGMGLQAHSLQPVVSSNALFQPPGNGAGSPRLLREFFAGGDQTFALVSTQSTLLPPVDFRHQRPLQLLPVFTDSKIAQIVALLKQLAEDALLDATTHRQLEVICASLSCWNGSFLGPGEEHFSSGLKNPGVDLPQALISLQSLDAACNTRIREGISEQLRHKLLPSLSLNPADIECLRIYLLLPLFPIFAQPLESEKVLNDIVPLATAMAHLQKEPEKVIKSWLADTDVDIFQMYIQLYKTCLVGILTTPKIGELIQNQKYWRGTQALLNAMALLYDTNNRLRSVMLPCEVFYVSEITEKVNIPMDYKNWYHAPENIRKETLSFCNYPFAFDPQGKTLLLQADSTLQMEKAVNSMSHMDYIHNIIRAAQVGQVSFNPQQIVFLNLYVSRENLLTDTLNQVWRFQEVELKRPLKVWFVGEEAEDAGGVKKEFFMLLMRELMDPKYGMFTYYEETHSIYFSGKSFECDSMFGVVGIICGLAIYNSTILDVRFPLAVYKKLLGIPTSLQDLDGLTPTVRRGLEQLLAYEGDDFEDVFSLNFTISSDYLGEMIVTHLKPNGAEIAVTKENRQEYCSLYVDHVLNRAVEKQFGMFAKGFHRVCGGKVLELFHPQELMAMVCGNENYDWIELQECATYKGDYSADHPIIKTFWKVFHSLTLDEKKKFLMFLTGCDRIPILGMKAVRIVIQPMGGDTRQDTDHLPVAHTCFNILDLPRYEDEKSLRSKLLSAMEHTQGFGLA